MFLMQIFHPELPKYVYDIALPHMYLIVMLFFHLNIRHVHSGHNISPGYLHNTHTDSVHPYGRYPPVGIVR